jgi:UDP-N-acetylglucosamine--N-acetylmuramyl-(pentapeptide) pyrophosphoryl-undecaprenol N-acetylglucosamine transferase
VHEQNAVAGTTNRLLAPLARVRLCGFPGAFSGVFSGVFSGLFSGRLEAQTVGNPLRASLLQAAAGLQRDYSEQRALRVLVLGGSLGAQPLNRLLPQALAVLQQQGALQRFEFWHQCGEGHLQALLEDYAQRGVDCSVRCMAFVEDMPAAYRWADLVICRAGALTVAELALMQLPAILVPLPHAIDDHQRHNARFLVNAGAALLCEQQLLDGPALAAQLQEFAAQPARLAAMSSAAGQCAYPQATAQVVAQVLAQAGVGPAEVAA